MRRRIVFKLEVYAFFFVLCCAFAAEKEAPTNLQIIESQVADLLAQAGADIVPDSGCGLIVDSAVPGHPLNALVKKQAFQWARSAGFATVYEGVPLQADSLHHYTLTFMPVRVNVQYQTTAEDRTLLQRLITTELLITLLTPVRQVVMSENKRAFFQDQIAARNFAQLETPELAFTQGEKPKQDKALSWLEPLLVAVVTGGIVYSFYSFRSK
ncbi:MAG: hypothetical protein BWY83_01602 [bacterium ADurb.Bin478]|nr:MAG: hypothetical protein BWY83_01602 [bacterium ADurb.Bin478]